MQGRSLFPFGDRDIHDFICAECGESVRSRLVESTFRPKLEVYDKGYKCLRTESYKYIVSADQKEELYDVKKDPLEKENMARKFPDKARNFRRQLENAVDISFFGPAAFPARKEREEILKKLKSLGYI